ncbi:MAG: acetyl-CoA C-acetyltransferase [Suipraeoptans sp.]
MGRIYIVAAKRTPVGSFNGALSSVPVSRLGAAVVEDILKNSNIPSSDIEEVISGTVLSAGVGQGPARQIALEAGVPQEVPAYTIDMVCGSGLKAVMNAATSIRAGIGDVYIAGGAENMSMAPYLIPSARQGLRMGNKEIVDHMVNDALTDAKGRYHMGITAENVAAKYHITREKQDEFSFKSQQNAIKAVDEGLFKQEIVPVMVKTRKGEITVDTDEYPNRATSPEKLSSLRPAFKPDGTVTAGNASGINDGAAYVMLTSEEGLKKYNLTPLAEVIGIGQGGVNPEVMGLGPVPAVRNALKDAKLSLEDINILELNEAFAAQSLGVIKELSSEHNIEEENLMKKTNLKGGAIALGHPVGASGARILVTLVHLLKERNEQYGLASLCIGGGMGTAVILKNT